MTSLDIHRYGCRVAANQNLGRLERNQSVIELSTKRHYLGYYEADLEKIENLSGSNFNCYVEHCVENGEVAHCHICLEQRDGVTFAAIGPKGERAEMIAKMWWTFAGPERHTCECDNSVAKKLNEIPLPTMVG